MVAIVLGYSVVCIGSLSVCCSDTGDRERNTKKRAVEGRVVNRCGKRVEGDGVSKNANKPEKPERVAREEINKKQRYARMERCR